MSNSTNGARSFAIHQRQERALWPVWIPLPSNPWRLSHVNGEFLRDENGRALTFMSALSAELYAKARGFDLLIDLGGSFGESAATA